MFYRDVSCRIENEEEGELELDVPTLKKGAFAGYKNSVVKYLVNSHQGEIRMSDLSILLNKTILLNKRYC
jgi:hypothetical protein